MRELINIIREIGAFSLDHIWFPTLIWTLCCVVAFIFLRLKKDLNPLFHYHLRTAAILSLPFGIFASFLLQWIPGWLSASPVETAFFIVQNPIEIVPGVTSSTVEEAIVWQHPSFLIGIITLILILGSLFMALRFINSYRELKALYKNLEFSTEAKQELITGHNIKLAYHDHHLVPFTFGWKNPVIVLPKILQRDSEKLNMALQHELIHIERGDYLLQLALSVIQSIFWFHPLIHFANQEIDTYREISCDQEVLSKTDFSIKSYANLLYELVPLNSGVGRLSVSMAVKNSTLKQRIKTMKYHKLHRASFKQSIFFLLLMVIGITLPIACSDLRGPEIISNEELENTQINIQDATLTVNGVSLDNQNFKDISAGGLGAISILAGEYGIFKVAPRQFDGGTKTGKIEGNNLSFKINELNVELNSSSEILKGISNSSLWVSHNREIAEATKKSPPMLITHENVNAPMNPPPPPSLSDPQESEEGDFFVVVEEMPQPIGGIQAIQSKVQYPEMAINEGREGRVTVQFIVNEEGKVEDAQVVRGIGGGADEEALRVVNETDFKPGIQKGQPVRVRFALSINFNLSDVD